MYWVRQLIEEPGADFGFLILCVKSPVKTLYNLKSGLVLITVSGPPQHSKYTYLIVHDVAICVYCYLPLSLGSYRLEAQLRHDGGLRVVGATLLRLTLQPPCKQNAIQNVLRMLTKHRYDGGTTPNHVSNYREVTMADRDNMYAFLMSNSTFYQNLTR